MALVALPLALGFGVASGVGAAAGITTAIVAGILAAIFGGSNVQVSGPTGAMTVVLIPIVANHGADGVLVVGVLAGLMLLLLAFTGAGRAMKYMPLPVVEGFTAGIALIIGLQQLPAALGVDVDGEKVLGLAGFPRPPRLPELPSMCGQVQAHAWQRCSIRCSCSSPYSSRPGGWARFLSPRSPACSSPQRFR